MSMDGPSSHGSKPLKRKATYPAAVDRLIAELARLPGVGRKSAERLAFFLLKSRDEDALALAEAITAVKKSVRHCAICSNLSDGDVCLVCADATRERGVVLVVEQPKDLIALEDTGMFRGLYHVLLGRLSPLDGIGPQELTVADLLRRVDDPGKNPGGVRVDEVILGLNPTVEGDGTSLYLTQELKSRGIRVSRLARGLPTGSQLEYVNKAVLADAIEGRRVVE
jgi:recombination protein RecR